MFNLTKGILKDIINRNFLTEQGSSQAKIVLRNYECPALVKVMGIQYHKNVNDVRILSKYIEKCMRYCMAIQNTSQHLLARKIIVNNK